MDPASRIVEKQQRLEARAELQQDSQLSELLEARLAGYLPGDVASFSRLVEVLTAHPLVARRWRDLSRQGQSLVVRDVRGEARAEEIDAFLAGCAELLVPVPDRPVRPVRIPYRQVDDRLYRSPQPNQQLLSELRDRGLRLVVNLRQECDQSQNLCAELGLDYQALPVPDQETPALSQVLEFLRVVAERGPALVHCWAGRGRTGLFVACYRVWRGMELDLAIERSDGEAVSRGMREVQRAWVRENARLLPRAPELPGPPGPA